MSSLKTAYYCANDQDLYRPLYGDMRTKRGEYEMIVKCTYNERNEWEIRFAIMGEQSANNIVNYWNKQWNSKFKYKLLSVRPG
jgi:hypothetical protein